MTRKPSRSVSEAGAAKVLAIDQGTSGTKALVLAPGRGAIGSGRDRGAPAPPSPRAGVDLIA